MGHYTGDDSTINRKVTHLNLYFLLKLKVKYQFPIYRFPSLANTMLTIKATLLKSSLYYKMSC